MDLLLQITTLVTRELELPEEPPAIEREFGIELEEDEFTRANFESIDAIAGLISKRLQV
jgi:hypothetical protein